MEEKNSDEPDILVPIVGIGASAGGLEAISQLFEALSPELGLAYLIVTHMDPRHESHLAGILATRTAIPVIEATEQVIQPDHAYIIPPDMVMTLSGNSLRLSRRTESSAKHLPVNALLESLAQERPGKAIGVILSGTGSDGTQGIKSIKEAAGVTIAQEQSSAAFDGMPTSAIQSGCIDLVLRPFEIAAELAKIAHHPYFNASHEDEATDPIPIEASLSNIFELINSVYQADFTQYKSTTYNAACNDGWP